MTRNLGESVNARLRNLARETGQDMMSLQTRYALERLLFRITRTQWGNRIALKGAMIFVVHYGDTHRPTSDMDINGYDLDGGVTTLEAIIRSAIGIDVADGVVFDASTIHVRKERDGQSVPGGKVELKARIHTSEVTVRVDAGFGNSVVPNATLAEYPSILPDMPRPTVLVYPFETTIAEKLHAMARHGAATTRIRDYYDLWLLSERHEFDGALLAEAVSSTFKRHATRVPGADMDALSDSFASLNRREWDKFRKGKGLRFQAPEMAAVVDRIREFVGPALDMATGGPDPGHWCGQGGWHCPTPAP